MGTDTLTELMNEHGLVGYKMRRQDAKAILFTFLYGDLNEVEKGVSLGELEIISSGTGRSYKDIPGFYDLPLDIQMMLHRYEADDRQRAKEIKGEWLT